jgi:hypothetical protein
MVTVCADATAEALALKLALVAPAATVTVPGTEISELLLARVTDNPPAGASAVRLTVQLSLASPVIDELVQVRSLGVAVATVGEDCLPFPFSCTVVVGADFALLVMVRVPLDVPCALGL